MGVGAGSRIGACPGRAKIRDAYRTYMINCCAWAWHSAIGLGEQSPVGVSGGGRVQNPAAIRPRLAPHAPCAYTCRMLKKLRARQSAPSPVTGRDDSHVVDWTQNLVLFFRILALFQLAKGMVHWGLLISITGEQTGPLAEEYLAANIYFAVLDPVAGVGLWLTSSWGAVLWLLAAVSQIAICLGFPEIFGQMWGLIAFNAIAILFYILLTWKVAQVSDD